MRVWIDDDECIGNGRCAATCPDVFKLVGDLAVVRMEEVLPELEDACREAAESCPVDAIHIHE